MEITTLRYFVTVADTLHFGLAAGKLHMSQPPLSRQIRKLEDQLRVTLFRRSKRRVELTHAGTIFLGAVRPLLEQLQEAVQTAQQAARGEIGQLAFAFIRGSAENVLQKVLSAATDELPKLQIRLHEMTIREQVDALTRGTIDVGLLRPPIADARIRTHTIFKEPFVAALPVGHKLTGKATLRVKDLADEPFIVLKPGLTALSEQVLQMCLRAGFTPAAVQEVTSMVTVNALVGAGMGVAILPRSIQTPAAREIVYKRLAGEVAMAELALAWRASNVSEAVQRLVTVCETALPKVQFRPDHRK